MSRVSRLSKFCAIILSFSCCSLRGQDSANTIGNVSISSPNAASLGKYGDIPVSYNTGIPDIGIPIYTIKSGSLQLPISITYHASGLKVQEQASWVGAGWSLNAGGVITRTVRGAADDRGYNNGYVTHGYYSDSGYYNYSFHPDGGVPSGAATNGTGPDDLQFVVGRKDGEPDLFTFNFNGHTGKFYFNDDQSPVLVPDEDCRIQTDFVSGPGFQGFIITTDDGVKYYFGKTGNNGSVDPVETTFFITTQSTYGISGRVASSWFLNKIVSADGMDSILLNYSQEKYSYYSLSMFPQYYQGTGLISALLGWASYPYEYDLEKNFIDGVRLNSIVFSNGTVTFNTDSTTRLDLAGYTDQTMNDQSDSTAKALESIQVSDSRGFCKKFKLFHNYFYDNANALNGDLFQVSYPTLNNISSDKYRLRLDSLQEMTCSGGLSIPPYKFTYFSELVPRNLSFGIDHWGFYNGVTGNSSLHAADTMITSRSFTVFSGANRDPAWPAMRGGSLQQITYPTGGYTLFEFEPNSTYTNFTDYQITNRISRSAGFDGHNGFLGDGGDNPDTITYAFDGSLYKLSVSNSSSGGLASLNIYPTGSFGSIYTLNVSAGQTIVDYLTLDAGSYWIKMYKDGATSGHGASYTLSEVIPVSITRNAMVGGLRIRTITNNSGGGGPDVVTSYGYNIANNPTGNSSGVLYSRPIYMQILRNDAIALIWGNAGASTYGCMDMNGSATFDYYRSPSSIRPMATMNGNHIGYNEVYVSQTNIGYSVYRYYGSNIWDNKTTDVCQRVLVQPTSCDLSIPNFPAPPETYEPLRGELKYEGHFRQDGQLLKEMYYYPEFYQELLPTPGHIAFKNPVWSSFSDYTLNTYKKTKVKVISTDYSSLTNYLTDSSTIYYNSAYNHKPTRIVKSTSLGDSLVSNIQYASDFRLSSCQAIPDSLTYYLDLVQSDSSSFFSAIATCTPQNFDAGYTNCRYLYLIVLRYQLSLARIQFMKYLKRSYSDPNSIFKSCHNTAKTNADTELKPILEMQDAFQDPIIEQSNWRNTNLLRSSFTRFDYVTNPSNRIYPNKIQLVSLSAPSTTFSVASVSGNSISKDSKYLDESTYSFNQGNLEQVIKHDGILHTYIWDYARTEPIAHIVNGSENESAYTSFEADGSGNFTIGSAYRDTNNVTGRKSYKLDSGYISKPGLTTSSTYIISYWSKNGSYSISGTSSNTLVTGKTINAWTYYEHKIVTSSTTVTISGAGLIDELRLYPSGAQMSTYTYDPLIGLTSQCDINNRITYYEYDSLGRLKLVRDQDKNILKTYDYKYQANSNQ